MTMDDRASAAMEGYLSGFAETVSTKRYISSVMDDVTSDLGYHFNLAVDRMARLNQREFQHVYESGDKYMDPAYIGNSLHRLWQLTFKGTSGTRTVGFVFKPSLRPVPIHPELLKPGGKKKRKVLKDIHIFTWKAPVMEYGLTVTITPELSENKFLAFFSEQYNKPLFTQRTIRTVPGNFADGGGTVGQFTRLFVHWWGTEAPARFQADIKPRLEQNLITEKDIRRGVSLARSGRTKLAAMGTDRWHEFNAARSRAKAEWQGRMHSNLARAKERREELYGY